MRTKALLFAAALGILGISSSLAQVYSVNAVGYINLPLKGGFQMIANQLDNKAGNKIGDVLKGVPNGTVLYKWTSTGYVIYTYDLDAWDPNADLTLAPGEGAFVLLPGAQGTPVVTVTLVGDVPQGALTVNLPAGFWIASSMVPQAVSLSDSAVAFPVTDGDLVYKWDNTTGYSIFTYDLGAWDPSAPSVGVGEAFFVYNVGAAATWTRNFSVN